MSLKHNSKKGTGNGDQTASRRSVLRSIVGASLPLGVVGTASAGRSRPRRSRLPTDHARAVKLRSVLNKLKRLPADSQEVKKIKRRIPSEFRSYLSQEPQEGFRNFIADRGHEWRYKHSEFPPENQVSAQAYDESKLNIDITLSYDCGTVNRVVADCYWEFEKKCILFPWETKGGKLPNDVIGMWWPSTDYSRIDGSEYTTNQYVKVGGQYGNLDPNGIAVEYNDLDAWNFQTPQSDSKTCSGLAAGSAIYGGFGCTLLQNNPNDPPVSRLVSGKYQHTDGGAGIQSISIGTSGLSVTFGGGNPTVWTHTLDEGEDGSSGNCDIGF